MSSIRILLASTLLVATLPAAWAQAEPPPAACDAGDVDEMRYFFGRADGPGVTGDDLSDAPQGGFVLVETAAGLDCEGAVLRVMTYTRPDLAVFDAGAREGFDLFAIAMVPDCAFRIEVVLSTAEGDAILDQADGGAGACDFGPLPCPGNVAATATDDGVLLTFDEVERTSETGTIAAYGVWRAEGDAEFETEPDVVQPVGFGGEIGTFLDEDVEPGVTYRYLVKAGGPRGESEGCDVVEATAVPFFGAPAIGALAAVGAVGAYAAMRRRP